MNSQRTVLFVFAALFLSAPALPVMAEEMVTIPKSRLEELERKEAELEKLKADLTTTTDQNKRIQKQREADAAEQERLKAELTKTMEQNVQIQKQREVEAAKDEQLKADLARTSAQNAQLQHEVAAAKVASSPSGEPAVTHQSPPMASLPPLGEGDTVDAMDLANYYRADSAAADQRYRKHEFLVRGEVAGFDKPIFRRDYKLILRTADRDTKVVCDIFPPDKYKAVFTVKNGSELVGVLPDESRAPLAKIGDTVTVVVRCNGLNDSVVTMSGGELKLVH